MAKQTVTIEEVWEAERKCRRLAKECSGGVATPEYEAAKKELKSKTKAYWATHEAYWH